ncbi:hypothetical protein AMS68_007236 [Peltaster fructicola]|uniref:C2H2-type domain-containing protein n=1 Tax=Peltaster fructicola TaxID=286661 RepID=A0A6H0Y4E4_9PEZI|nr:hypothetical protein AMS68_007236 [Peltaster fructicola]
MDDPISSLYPPIPDATGVMSSAYPMQPQIAQLPLQDPVANLYRSSNSPASEPSRVSTVSATSTNNAAKAAAAPKKNQYPCPMAKQYNCNDFFTTSGHAARHAKKHTGKKDAFCPECNKAFTRKDNMEQHRRTHQNGRGTGRTSDDKVKKSSKAPVKKAASVKSEPALEAAVEQQLAQQRQEEQQAQAAAQLQAVTQAQVAVAQQQQHLQAVEAALLNPGPSGPYFLSGLDVGPISALPMPAMGDMSVRPPLLRSNLTTSLDYIPPLLGPLDPETLNYSYPSPGLSNGLNSLALAASEHRRLTEEKARSPPSESNETPSTESP